MTITRAFGRIELTCDACDTAWHQTHEPGDFEVMLTDAKLAGWRASRAGLTWTHICGHCTARRRTTTGTPGVNAASGDLFGQGRKP